MNSRMTCAAGRSCAWQASRNSSRRAFSTRMRSPESFPDMVGSVTNGYTNRKRLLVSIQRENAIQSADGWSVGSRGASEAPIVEGVQRGVESRLWSWGIGEQERALIGGATAKRCCGGEAGPDHRERVYEPPLAERDAMGDAQRVSLAKIGVVLPRTSCGSR